MSTLTNKEIIEDEDLNKKNKHIAHVGRRGGDLGMSVEQAEEYVKLFTAAPKMKQLLTAALSDLHRYSSVIPDGAKWDIRAQNLDDLIVEIDTLFELEPPAPLLEFSVRCFQDRHGRYLSITASNDSAGIIKAVDETAVWDILSLRDTEDSELNIKTRWNVNLITPKNRNHLI